MNLKTNKTLLILLLLLSSAFGFSQSNTHPNVILIITDDQGYGDLGITGNPHVKTPVIDKFASENIRFNKFYVSPVCAPTRSSLMTGRYSLRTGVRDTYNGGATMAGNEVTIAEMLKQANYTSGAFGKWHLGDNFPSRPNDQGFDESVIHLAGGMGQVGDFTNYFKFDKSYFDPVLWHNGQTEQYQGYCSDIFTDQAIQFIEKNKQHPFFCYLAFNAPHTPLQVPEKYYEMYKDIDPTSGFEADNRPFPEMTEKDKEDARKVYAMVTNIDDNVGKLLKKLDELNVAENTVVVFMTDNGPQQRRYVAGMRGKKGTVYRGGVRVPFFIRLPGAAHGSKSIETTTAHIDILPTLADICKVDLPKDKKIDGKSLLPLILDKKIDWANRPLFFYWTRRYPELYYGMALQKGKFKLVGHTDYNANIEAFELFDIETDGFEQNNIVQNNKDLAKELKSELEKFYYELIGSENLNNSQAIWVGNKNENPVVLNRNDAGGDRGIWSQEEIYGKWDVSIEEGTYNAKFKFIKPLETAGRMYLEMGSVINQIQNHTTNTDIIEMKNIHLNKMDGELIPFYSTGGKRIFPFWVELEKLD
ncbi:arylsulfatase [Prolixibacteraceae bacterium Z1-6]|uniref:Arylsulfatase n=1 Tax=Draconibacterium aestuarii TaxID=2998507 RepID=A0A9X3F2U8_9BACT|nr:arylsulfatase [Prolixibacteraceae bacterium Z1-6]